MKRKFIATAILALAVVGATTIWIRSYVELKSAEYRPAELRELSDVEKWQSFLFEESVRAGLKYSEFRLLKSIVNCESTWRQFNRDGSVVLSSGNIGLAQINRFAHERTYTQMNLDPNNPYDNLKFMVFLYQRDGISPWEKWSGHCWNKGRK